jgi:hypothetical protein
MPRAARGPRRMLAVALVAGLLAGLVPGAWSAGTAPSMPAGSGAGNASGIGGESALAGRSAAAVPTPAREPAAPPSPARSALGRLFFTPQDRAAIDSGQLAPIAPASRGPAPAENAAVSPASPATTRIDGFMRRPNAPPVVWVDGAPVESDTGSSRDAADGRSVRLAQDGDSVRVRRPDGSALDLLPGQSSGSPELGAGNRFEVLR